MKSKWREKKVVISPLTFSTSIRSQHMLKLYCFMYIIVYELCLCFVHMYGSLTLSLSIHTTTSSAAFFTASAIIIIGLHCFLLLCERIFFVIVIWSRVPFKKTKSKQCTHWFHAQHKYWISVCVCVGIICRFYLFFNNFTGIVNIWLKLF